MGMGLEHGKAFKVGRSRPEISEDAAVKAVPAITAALKGKPAGLGSQMDRVLASVWRHQCRETVGRKLPRTAAKQRANAVQLFNESQTLFRSDKRDEAFKVLEKLRDEAPFTYQAYFACKWLSERK
jgi:hypothetical protein